MSNYNWTATGILPTSVRETFNCADTYWSDSGISIARGHRYLAVNSLGSSNKTFQELASSVKFNLGLVFPGGASGSLGQAVVMNNVFSLGLPRFRVRVVAIDSWSFTLKTEPWHILVGTARTEFLKIARTNVG